ncbi:large subunit ribosomal protein LP2 [Enteropsectra breve]|nr:large subunit ribosomal protein LP2 [Enteropsectra breve]
MQKYISAYLLNVMNNREPSEQNIRSVLNAINAKINEEDLAEIMALVSSKSYEEIINAGASMMTLQNAAAAPSSAAAPAAKAAAAADDDEEDSDEAEISLF